MEIKKVSKVTDKIVSYSDRQGSSSFKNSLSKYFIFQKISESFKNTPPPGKVDYHNW